MKLTDQDIEVISELLSDHISLLEYKIKMKQFLEIPLKQSLIDLKEYEIELFNKINNKKSVGKNI